MLKQLVIKNVINIMLSNLSSTVIRQFLLNTIKTIKKGIEDSESKIDDAIGLPLIRMLEEILEEEKPKTAIKTQVGAKNEKTL